MMGDISWESVVLAGLVVGALCGVIPLSCVTAPHQRLWGALGFALCLLLGFIGGLLLAIPGTIIATMLVLRAPRRDA